MTIINFSTHLARSEIQRLETLALKLMKEILPRETLGMVRANYGKRIIIGEPVQINHTHWSPKFLHTNGNGDITGRKGFLVFYAGQSINWQGADTDKVNVGPYLQITSVGRDDPSIRGFFFQLLEQIPTWSAQHKVSFVIQEVIQHRLLQYFRSKPEIWKATKCSTNQGINDWSFYHQPNL